MLAARGVLLSHLQLRPRTQALPKSMLGSQHPLSCLLTQPGCQGDVLVGAKSSQGKEFLLGLGFFFLIFPTQNIRSPRCSEPSEQS